MNPAVVRLGVKVAGILGTALLGAFSLFLSRILEPLIAWFTFTGLKLLIKVTKSKTLRSMYADIHKGYKEEKNKWGGSSNEEGPPGGYQ